MQSRPEVHDSLNDLKSLMSVWTSLVSAFCCTAGAADQKIHLHPRLCFLQVPGGPGAGSVGSARCMARHLRGASHATLRAMGC